jgi:glycosyltransferase involved in cell wall biosynthesis
VKVSAIIPTFNSAAFISQAIESVRAQTCSVDEIVVVDDGSTDATKEIAAGYPEVKIIGQNHLGPAAARNTGIRQVRTEYIAFLDSDDIWLPNKIETQISAFDTYPSAAFSFAPLSAFHMFEAVFDPNELYLPHELRSWCGVHSDRDGMAFGDVYSLLLRVNCMQTSSVMARRQAVMDVGMFDESLIHGEDHDLWLRLARRWSAVYIAAPIAKYRVHPSALSGSGLKRQEVFYRATINTLSKHARMYPSFEASKAVARSYNDYTAHLLKARRGQEARRSAAKSLLRMPTPFGVRLLIEAVFPKTYCRVMSILDDGRA